MKIVDIAIKRPVTIWMFVLAVMLFGMVSLSRLSVDLLPELSYPTLTIRTDYEGAAPAEVEQLVSKAIEESVGTIKNVRQVTSISKASQSDVVLEFDWGTDMDMASLNVREKLDILMLPLDVTKPVLLRFNPSLDPIIRYALKPTSEQYDLKAIRNYAEEEIKRKFEAVNGIASVKLGGGLEQEIHVSIDQYKLAHHKLDVSHVLTRLREENVNMSGGRVKDKSQDYLVRTINQFKDLNDIRDLIIKHDNNRIVRLSDIATVTDSHKERDSITQIDGDEAIEIAIYKEGDANVVRVSELLQNQIKAIESSLPANLSLTPVYDQARFISSAVNEVKTAAVIGGVLAMLVLYLFLRNTWTTFIISLSIPVSVIATFNFMYGNNISLNIMSLGGIALAIGLLVDSAIVVLENIARQKELGLDPKQASAKGTKEVSTAIIASTLTTMAVFFPLAFVEGIAGQLFSDQALAVTFALLASLVVALTLIPMLASRERREVSLDSDPFIQPGEKHKPTGKVKLAFWYLIWPIRKVFWIIFSVIPLLLSIVFKTLYRAIAKVSGFIFKPMATGFNAVYNKFAHAYEAALKGALKRPIVTLASILLVSAGSIPLVNKLGSELLPPMAQGEFYVDIVMPTGTKLVDTERRLSGVAKVASEHQSVARTYSTIGTGSLMNASPGQSGDNWGRLNVVLKPNVSSDEEKMVVEYIRQHLSSIPGANSTIERPKLLSFKAPIQIVLAGYDLTQLQMYSDRLTKTLSEQAVLADINPSLKRGHPEIKLAFNHGRLAQLGLTASQVSEVVATQIGGKVATKLSVGDRKVDILVRSAELARNSISDLEQLVINPSVNQPITLSSVADITVTTGPSEINRLQQQRVALIDVNVATGDLAAAVEIVEKVIADAKLPLAIQASVQGQNEDMRVSFNSLTIALALAVFMVYIVMASQFESFLHPLIILFTVPLAGAGSIYGLYLTQSNLSVVVFIGLIMLAGIVVNNAIVLIDRINQLRATGMDKLDAIIESAKTRLRPIVMTTLTTTLGLLPLALGLGDGAEIRAPMALTVIFGLVFATLLTLLFIPSLYLLLDTKTYSASKSDEVKQEFLVSK
jgi:HAE1 family hydrophobic/amphiphilic exporter-1